MEDLGGWPSGALGQVARWDKWRKGTSGRVGVRSLKKSGLGLADGQLAGNGGEHRSHVAGQRGHGGENGDRDAGKDKAILNGRGAGFVFEGPYGRMFHFRVLPPESLEDVRLPTSVFVAAEVGTSPATGPVTT